MKRRFNVKGVCIPTKHYMVDVSDRLEKLKVLVDAAKYLVINRGHQYGKTTTLVAFVNYLADEYPVISLNFQGLGEEIFSSEAKFCQAFLTKVATCLKRLNLATGWLNAQVETFFELSQHLTAMCANQKFILIIDETDVASNYQVFLDFLGILRDKYQLRALGQDFTFHSVILAGVYDLKKLNCGGSPWNIAWDFTERMAFSALDIASMLSDYEADQQTGMNLAEIAAEIYAYTSGYPFLVCRICEYLDEELGKNWTTANVGKAVKLIIGETRPNTLFDDLFQNVRNYPELADFLYGVLMTGKSYKFSQQNEVMAHALRYAFVRNVDHQLRLHNRIFEIIMADYFISKERLAEDKAVYNRLEIDVFADGKFNIERFFEKFSDHYQLHYSQRSETFVEREAVFLFLFFLQPYLDEKGSYYLESKPNLAVGKRMGVVIVYDQQEFIIELKCWHGELYQQDAYRLLTDYVKQRDANAGYLLTFDFRQQKEVKQEWISVHGTSILEVQV